MRIKVIICGWWYDKFDHRENLTEFIEGLISLNENNNNIDIFWACHKEPIDLVKNNFEWKLYENVGLEWGAYNKAFNELEFEDDDSVVDEAEDTLTILSNYIDTLNIQKNKKELDNLIRTLYNEALDYEITA